MKNNYLSEREMNVMQVLWKYEKPMTVTEIVESEKELTTPTVYTVLRKLLDKGYVQVIDTVQTGKVFARRYKAKKTQDEEIAAQQHIGKLRRIDVGRYDGARERGQRRADDIAVGLHVVLGGLVRIGIYIEVVGGAGRTDKYQRSQSRF